MLAGYSMPIYADENAQADNFEEYKCDLMMKGYEFTNDGLSEAIIKNDTEAVELFVKADININLPDNEGYSALDRAIKVNDKEAVMLLSKAGGETKMLKNVVSDLQPVDSAQNSSQTSEQVSEQAQTETVAEQQQASSAVQAQVETQVQIVEQNQDCSQEQPQQQNAFENYPMIKSETIDDTTVSENSVTIDKTLLALAQKAPVKSQNISAQEQKQQIVNSFCELINTDNTAEVAKVAKHFFGMNMMTKDGLAPLHYAVFNDNAEMVKLLLDNGADVNKKTSDGLTSLDIAVLNNQQAVIQILLSQGGALSGQVATELKKLGCKLNFDSTLNLYDTTFDDLLPILKKIQSSLDNE